jgi:pyruvate dehydrogenase E2 component (dihydrolipoamide acetyltransferase)
MPTDVIMPQMGESIFEGTITKWLKQTGDPVEKDEPLFEISTDKVDAEIPSPVAGVLTEIKFPEGAIVQVNTVVAVLSENGSAAGKSAKQNKSGASPVRAEEIPVQAPPSRGREGAQTPGIVPPPAGTTVIVMPQMGESIFEGTITRWLKKAGEAVQKDEPLFEISTDKVDAEIPSPVDGVLSEIKFPEGATVEVNAVVALLSSPAAALPTAESSAPRVTGEVRSPSPTAPHQSEPGVQLRSSPLVRRIAKEHQIDLALVPGTGSNGRITKEDILEYLGRSRSDGQTSGRPQAASAPPPEPQASGAAASLLPRAQSAASEPPRLKSEVVPLTKMRALIAERMAESVRTIPHAHTVYKVDMTRIVRLRDRQRAAFEQRYGFKLTYMPFVALAAIDALRRFPILNASLVDSGIQYHGSIHLGIAVALEWGLIVPVVRESETLDFLALARAINDLATRARAKKLMPDQVGGSTFTLTNPGVFGGEYGMPIINQPDSAILAIGGLRKEAVVLTDGEGNDTIAIRSVQYFCLGFDHRLIDGADSGKFMTAFKSALENWDRAIP